MPKTTFIIGAAASKSLVPEYPLGSQLKKMIAKGAPPSITHQIGDRAAALVNQVRRSPHSSIDAFMANAANEESEIARQCIAGYLLPLDYHVIQNGLDDYDWFSEFANHFSRNPNLLFSHEYRFVVFNYDRLLEILLYNLFAGRGQLPHDEAWGRVKQCAIEHVYGFLDYDLAGLLQYPHRLKNHQSPISKYPHHIGCARLGADAIKAALGIRLMTSERNQESDEGLQRIREWIESSSRLVFLGFGFAFDNVRIIGAEKFGGHVRRLDSNGRMVNMYSKFVYASMFEHGRAERRRVARLIANSDAYVNLGEPEQGCFQFLKDHCADWLEADALSR
ncbi:MAG TPA: hypothetical protein VK176_03290 [Phycisphaerales bacterium]|nr:hypothetical protein [Phycisphaerales bacterium]